MRAEIDLARLARLAHYRRLWEAGEVRWRAETFEERADFVLKRWAKTLEALAK